MLMFKMAWKNMWRNRHRTAITMAAILFAVVLSVLTSSLKTGIFDNLIRNMVGYYSGYIQIHKKGYWEEQVLDNIFSASTKTEKIALSDLGISAITPRLESFALVSSGLNTKGCLVAGISPLTENRITGLRSRVISGNYLNPDDHSVMIAEGLQKRLGVQLNDTIVLLGQGYHGATAAGKYRIGAIMKFGSPELNDKALFMELSNAQELYAAEGMISSYVLSIRNPDKLNHSAQLIQRELGDAYEVMTWEQMMPDIRQHIRSDTANMQIVQGILYLLICFGIFSTLLMMMAERKFELGMLVAIGMNKWKLATMLMAESVLTVLGGCIMGILISIPAVYYLNRFPIRITGDAARAYEKFGFEPIFPASVNSEHFIGQGLNVLFIGLMLSLYTVYRVWKLDPVTAMRK